MGERGVGSVGGLWFWRPPTFGQPPRRGFVGELVDKLDVVYCGWNTAM